jgi:hypothetical protein
MLTEMQIPTKLIVRTDSAAAKQSVEKVGLLHMKHMSMRMLFLKDLQKNGHMTVEKILGTENPADMFTKPLLADQFQRCKDRLPGIVWSNGGEDEHEVQTLEVIDTDEGQIDNLNPVTAIFYKFVNTLRSIGELAQLVVYIIGVSSIVRYFCCPRRAASTRTVAVQAPCTYTSLRGVANPRFLPLSEKELEVVVERQRSSSSRRSVG